MRRASCVLLCLLFWVAPVAASEPVLTGEWADEDGLAHIRVENCGGRYWGAVSWEKEPGVDDKNPDAAKRGLPTLGMPVFLSMKPTDPNRGEGQIYNSENGKTYSGSITLTSRGKLKVKGCVLGLLCGSQEWRRVSPKQSAKSQSGEIAAQSSREFCANIARRTGE